MQRYLAYLCEEGLNLCINNEKRLRGEVSFLKFFNNVENKNNSRASDAPVGIDSARKGLVSLQKLPLGGPVLIRF